jgi:Fe-S-cluster containining protein
MGRGELPIFNFAEFRKYPARQGQQEYDDDSQVCGSCVSGGCCSSEDPIYLTSFDVFRLASFFNMSTAEFMLNFTQERFGDPESDEIRRLLIDDPNSSIVTYLRRRANFPTSPCIFLKYIRDRDGSPRRICSVHDGRPLSCREYYFSHCKTRVTGELASLQAEGFEKIRDGEITEAMVDAELARFGKHDPQKATLSCNMDYFFWVEMKRAINIDQANVEGANSYDMAVYQDSIDVKLNRVLSSKYLRFEEKYGPGPRDEQLMPYTAGLGWAGSAEYERIMMLLHTPPSTGLYALGNYPFYVGLRTALPGAKYPSEFPIIPDAEINAFIRSIPHVRLFPHHDAAEVQAITLRDVYASVLKGYNHLIRFASYIATMGNVLEDCEPGFIESEIFLMIVGFETSLNPFIAQNPYFQPVKHYMARIVIDRIEKRLASAVSPKETFDNLRFIYRIKRAVPSLPADLRARFETVIATMDARLQKERLALYIGLDNPIVAREKAGKRLNVRRAWAEWYDQVLDMRYATLAGFDCIDLPAFYRQSVEDLEKIPLRKSYVLDLYDMVYNLTCSMSFHNTIAYPEMAYKDAARRLAAYSVRLFNWMKDMEYETSDCEIMSGFLSPVYKGLGLSYNYDHSFGLILYLLLDRQLPNGSWQTDPSPENMPDTQSEYICTMYRATWACIDGIRPMRSDTSNTENASLGLV